MAHAPARGPAGEAVTVALWESAPSPFGFRELWCEELHSLSELAKLRARLRRSLTGSPTVVHPEREHWSERLVLIADELTSNALRHGGAPVATALSRTGDRWLLAVSDSSTEVPPTPAVGRDPGLGGFGLYLVADLSQRHGWFVERGTKTVWAEIEAVEG
ncbi:ATP-binding protein [Blastococcus litoris]|uniref:ATP-binding protein n=1 Tax=Blastococcus litoris TaxID=2171622 RepID=UPI001F1292BD|nr:ATP-binding protein [Blastococcus litoris]